MTLPELHLADWRATKDTLHLYSQIVGKIRMATTAPRNHWWNVPLYVDVRGLTTRRLHHHDTTFEITLDFVDHVVIVRTADGRTGLFGLGEGLPVADFDARLHELLGELGVDVEISGASVRRPDDDAVPRGRRARVLGSRGDRALRPDPGLVGFGVRGVQRLVQRQDEPRAPVLARPRPRGHPVLRPAGRAERRRSGHPGGLLAGGHLVRVLGRRRQRRRRRVLLLHRPRARGATRSTAVRGRVDRVRRRLAGDPPLRDGAHLPYETVRSAPDPRRTLLAFCQSAYEAGARLAGWDIADFESTWCPSPAQLRQLHVEAAAAFGRTTEKDRLA